MPVDARFDAMVIGAGILGAATASRLCARRPGWRVLVVEKEPGPARHQTGRNSGVLHSGVYYTPGGLKARLCAEGLERTRALCAARGIGFERRGKLLVATDDADKARLDALRVRAVQNGVVTEDLDAAGLRRLEPHVAGQAALRIPATAIVDYVAMTRSLLGDVETAGGEVRFEAEVTGCDAVGAGYRLRVGGASIETTRVIGCGGLASDRLARLAGLDPEIRILPFRGEYYVLDPRLNAVVHHLIYPVPNPALPFLGVHLTPMIDGSITVGPNAVLSLARERYGRFAVSPLDAASALTYPGLWRTLMRHKKASFDELRGSLFKSVFLRQVQRYCPELRMQDLRGYRAGNRAQAVRRDGTLVDDFLVEQRDGITMVLNAPSPAATSALPIADYLCDRILG